MFPIRSMVQLVKVTAVTTATVVTTGAAAGGLVLAGVGAARSLYRWASGEGRKLEQKVDETLHDHAHRTSSVG